MEVQPVGLAHRVQEDQAVISKEERERDAAWCKAAGAEGVLRILRGGQ